MYLHKHEHTCAYTFTPQKNKLKEIPFVPGHGVIAVAYPNAEMAQMVSKGP